MPEGIVAMEYLEIQDVSGRRQQIPLNRPRFIIGREPTCDIPLSHPGVSRRHAQLQRTDQGRWLLQDLNSRNRVFVGNEAVQQIVLEPRKPFTIADYTLSLHEITPPPDVLQSLEDDTAIVKQDDDSWLERLRFLQRSLIILDKPRSILERLAEEFERFLEPAVLAIGVAKPDGYTWDIVRARNGMNAPLKEADRHVIEDPSSFLSWNARASMSGSKSDNPSACMLFPIKGRNHIVGHVFCVGASKESLPKHARRYFSLAATQAGLIYDNLLLSDLRQSQIAVEKELHQARQIQMDLFPPSFDVYPCLDAYAVNLPSAQVSGDYYDLFQINNDEVAFVIADAMGHGMPAALLMAAVRAALRMGLKLSLSWSDIFRGLDDLIRQARENTFVTGMLGCINLTKQELHLVSAGHPLPSILVDGERREIPEHCQSRPWGLDMPSNWEVGRISLQGRRWSIIAYTDGITRRSFGSARINAYHERHHLLAAEDLCQGLLSEISGQSGSLLEDDQTVLVICSK